MSEIQFKSTIDVELIQSMGGDHMVVASAKVSTNGVAAVGFANGTAKNDKGDPWSDKDTTGLVNYLVKHRHGTPFEHSVLTFFVHAPILVWREWHRHRIGFCLAGDTLIKYGAGVACERPISELYQNWHFGVQDADFVRKPAIGIHQLKKNGRWRVQGTRQDENGNRRGNHLGYYATKEEAVAVYEEWVEKHPTSGRVRLLPSCQNLATRVLNEQTQFFERGRMANIMQSGVKELVEVVTVKGHRLKCSKDHKILSEGGWVTAGELRKGDCIAVLGKRSKWAERQIPPSLRAGIGVWTSMQRSRLIKEVDQCYICGWDYDRSELVLDHVVPVASDILRALDVTNLKPACEGCHRIKSNGEQKLARRGCVAGSRFVQVASTPQVCGEDMTYDIEMEGPHHNFLANGIVVHNSYNEESGRYKTLEPIFYLPDRERPMMKVEGWKPGRPKFTRCEDDVTFNRLCNNLSGVYEQAYRAYEDNLSLGIDPGLARDCLPVGIYSGCWVTCNPRSLMAFLSLRVHEPTAAYPSYPLWEIDVAARAAEVLFAKGWPITHKAFVDNGRVAP